MDSLFYLPFFLETVVLFCAAKLVLVSNLPKSSFHRYFQLWIFLTLVVMMAAIVIGGKPVVGMSLKVILFGSALFFSVRNASSAKRFLIFSILLLFSIQTIDGKFYSKLTTVPFLLFTLLWISNKHELQKRHWLILFFSIICELTQAIILESRGLLLASFLSMVIIIAPLRKLKILIFLFAVIFPILYPAILSLVFSQITSGSSVFEGTASNYERSSMLWWSVNNLGSYILVGPGAEFFTSEINFFKELEQRAVADLYDPHHFLLSSWVYLGSAAASFLYVLWVMFWCANLNGNVGAYDVKMKIFSVLAVIGIVTFTVSPPDSSTRMQVALVIGIAVAGMRDRSVLFRNLPLKNIPLVPSVA